MKPMTSEFREKICECCPINKTCYKEYTLIPNHFTAPTNDRVNKPYIICQYYKE